MHKPLSGAVLAHDRLFRPAGTLLESDSVEMAERSISTGLEKFVASRVKSHLTNLILGFVFFARVPYVCVSDQQRQFASTSPSSTFRGQKSSYIRQNYRRKVLMRNQYKPQLGAARS